MKQLFNLLIIVISAILYSCNEDPFDDLTLVDHPYSYNSNLTGAIKITDISIGGYSIHPFTKDTVSAKILIKCNLDTNYFGVSIFHPKYEVTPELYVGNSLVVHKTEPKSELYNAYINYPSLKNKEFAIIFKFHLYNDTVSYNNRKIASNSVLFSFK